MLIMLARYSSLKWLVEINYCIYCIATYNAKFAYHLPCTLLTKGVQVDYAARIAGIEPGPANIRCLLLCWTGDHPAQCEVGKFLGAGGFSACRRDKVQGINK